MIPNVRTRILWITKPQRRALAWVVLTGFWAAGAMFMWVGRPWWDPPLRGMALAGGGVALVTGALGIWIAKGRRWAFWFLAAVLLAWTATMAMVALIRTDFWFGLFSLALSAHSGWTLVLFWRNLRRSYVDPAWRWFQGQPSPIPHLTCHVMDQEFRVCRFDREGAYVFSPGASNSRKKLSRKVVPLVFQFENDSVECKGMVVSESDQGWGFQFDPYHGATSKNVGDLFERMKGRGYAIDER